MTFKNLNFAGMAGVGSILIGLVFASANIAVAAPGKATGKSKTPTPAAKVTKTPRAAVAVSDPKEVQLAHQLNDVQAKNLQKLIDRFNSQNKGLPLTLIRRTVDATPAVLNLVMREDVSRFVGKNGYRPLYQVMSEAKQAFNTSAFSPDLKAGVVDGQGRYKALPIAYSTPVLYYNKTLFKQAQLDPDSPPKTWREVQQVAGKLADAGIKCPYTTSRPAWIHIDNLAARHGEPLSDKSSKRLMFNNMVDVKHFALLSSWAKSDYLIYFGRGDEANDHFAKGECGMLTSDSYLATIWGADLGENSVDFAVAPLPYHDDVRGAPQNTLADGASLWVGASGKAQEYKTVAQFVSFLLSPEIQVEFAHLGGFLPLTEAARAATQGKLLAEESANLNMARKQLQGKGSAYPLRISQVGPLRMVAEEELEAVWDGRKSAKAALDTAVERGDVLLKSLPKGAVP